MTDAQFHQLDRKLTVIADRMMSGKQFGWSIFTGNLLTVCIAMQIFLLLTGCTLRPTEVAPINGIKTYSVTSNRVINGAPGNPDDLFEALLQLEADAVPAYMQSVCGNRGHRVIDRLGVIDEPWTGGGGGRFIKQTYIVQCQ